MAISPFRLPSGVILKPRQVNHYRQQLIADRTSIDTGDRAGIAGTPCEHFYRLDRPTETHTLIGMLSGICRVRLTSPYSSTRSFVLRQICLQWAFGELPTLKAIPLLLTLPEISLSLEQAVSAALHQTGFHHDIMALRRGFAAGRWLLLLDCWDLLAPTAQSEWRRWVIEALYRYPALSVVITTGPDQQPWPHLESWALADTDEPSLQDPPGPDIGPTNCNLGPSNSDR